MFNLFDSMLPVFDCIDSSVPALRHGVDKPDIALQHSPSSLSIATHATPYTPL